ncbi:MAG: S-methyl-5'-thioadenosine phosphorylase [Actinobacteria bacterium]|nr:S-methyl-5'-thioadenosine phosphorylase [Actinomycetota bacterium]MBW3641514.1 S-methyl-5'-thioadenosine phosphorylase [Actinomycetota bacterium]
MAPGASLGILGGSGFYRLLDDVEERTVDTPFGPPSGPVGLGRLHGDNVAFLPRHGAGHEHPPHRINYRANLWALHVLGVRRVLGPCAAGSLQPHVHPGDFVVCDQLVDRTWGRRGTFFDGPVANHVAFAEPYCPELRADLVAAAHRSELPALDGGTVVVVQGPRFSTRAESTWYRDQGWEVVNMTQSPEAVLARELGMCYATVALITDYDAGIDALDGAGAVTQETVFSFFEENLGRLRTLLLAALERIGSQEDAGCDCAAAPNGMVPFPPGAAGA